MSFQAYIDKVEAQTGLTIADLSARAEAEGLIAEQALAPGVKATQVTDWLKAEFGLGQGHAMSAYASFTGKRS